MMSGMPSGPHDHDCQCYRCVSRREPAAPAAPEQPIMCVGCEHLIHLAGHCPHCACIASSGRRQPAHPAPAAPEQPCPHGYPAGMRCIVCDAGQPAHPAPAAPFTHNGFSANDIAHRWVDSDTGNLHLELGAEIAAFAEAYATSKLARAEQEVKTLREERDSLRAAIVRIGNATYWSQIRDIAEAVLAKGSE